MSVPGGEVRLKGAMVVVVVVVLAEVMAAVLVSQRRRKCLSVPVDRMREKRAVFMFRVEDARGDELWRGVGVPAVCGKAGPL